jgi:hypothetical protein
MHPRSDHMTLVRWTCLGLAAALLGCGSGDAPADAGLDSAVVDTAEAGDLPLDGAVEQASGAPGLDGAPDLGPSTLVLSEAGYDFGTVAKDDTPTTMVRVTNGGPPATGPVLVSLMGDPSFKLVSNTCAELVAGGSCNLEVAFYAQQVGTHEATLRVSASPGGAALMTLQGSVIEP